MPLSTHVKSLMLAPKPRLICSIPSKSYLMYKPKKTVNDQDEVVFVYQLLDQMGRLNSLVPTQTAQQVNNE